MPLRAFFPPLLAAGLLRRFPFLLLLVPIFCPLTSRGQSALTPAMNPTTRNILFFGDSITAGYGLANPSAEAFPALVARKIKEANLPFNCVNAGLSGDTTSGGLRRIDWLLQRPVDILVLELGGNDGLRGLPTPETARNLQAIIDKTLAKYPQAKIVVAGMRMPPNFGADYVSRFEAVFPAVTNANPGTTLLPFILEGVGGLSKYNQRDQIHPTAEGHRIIADMVWQTLEPVCRAEVKAAAPAGL